MRLITAALVIGVCVAGAALAQDAPPRPTIVWEETPEGADYARYYPDAAVRQRIVGAAVACCLVNTSRRLDCHIMAEWPQDYGFGDASIAVTRRFAVSQQSYDQLVATGDMSLRRTFRWTMPSRRGAAEELERAVTQMTAATENQCGPISSTPVS